MTENTKDTTEVEATPSTYCYSYEVTMVVQIFAQNEDQARATLDSSGGYVSKRDVVLKDTVSVYTGSNE
jgi:hypothetical protein